jgi:shikimate dehydrogenase
MHKNCLPKVYGVLGYPARHSLSPLMHNAAFRALKINAEYKIFEVEPERLKAFLLKTVFRENISGLNITIPYKVKAREILEKEFPLDKDSPKMLDTLYYVKLSGAINTVRIDGNKLQYWNTDATGFLRSLKEVLSFDPKGNKVLLIGCGGVGRAIIASLSWINVGTNKIYINDINAEAINSAKAHFSQFPQYSYLKDMLQFILTEEIPGVIKDCSLLVNATPIGMEDADGSIIDKNLLHKELYVYDVVYNRSAQTRLIKDAKLQGLRVVEGLDMLLYQGIGAFELWAGQIAPVEAMREALKRGVNPVRNFA